MPEPSGGGGVKDQDRCNKAKAGGIGAGGLAGAAVGAELAAGAAGFTFGLSVLVGAAIGAIAGVLTVEGTVDACAEKTETSAPKRQAGFIIAGGLLGAGAGAHVYAGFCSDRGPRWPSIWAAGCPTARAAYPGFEGRAVLPLFGLAPGGACRAARVTPGAGALLPHRFTLTCAPDPETRRHRRSALCCAVLRVAPTGCYPAPCPVESGRSSDRSRLATARSAATRPTRYRVPAYDASRRARRGRTRTEEPAEHAERGGDHEVAEELPGPQRGAVPGEEPAVLVAHQPDDDAHRDPEHERADAGERAVGEGRVGHEPAGQPARRARTRPGSRRTAGRSSRCR